MVKFPWAQQSSDPRGLLSQQKGGCSWSCLEVSECFQKVSAACAPPPVLPQIRVLHAGLGIRPHVGVWCSAANDMPPVGNAIPNSRASAAHLWTSSAIDSGIFSSSVKFRTLPPRQRQLVSRLPKSARLCVQAVNSSLDERRIRPRDDASSSVEGDRVESSTELPEGALVV